MAEENKDAVAMKEYEQLFAECRQQLRQVEAVLEKEEKAEKKNDKRIEDYQKLKAELVQKKASYEQTLEDLRKIEEDKLMQTQFSNEPILKEDINKVATAYFEEEKKWYAARILNVEEVTQTAEILWIGFKDKATLPAKYIKTQKVPEPSELTTGTYCEAIYADDGRWYPCLIEKVTVDGYEIKFKKYGTSAVVQREYIRTTKDGKAIKRPFEEMTTFKTPEHLKIRPTDTPEQKKQKKKKIKAIKQHVKTRVLDKEAKDRQGTWLGFNSEAAKSKKGYYALKKGESIFKSPDTVEGRVGVTGSGKGMTGANSKNKFTDNKTHKSRLF